MSESNEKTPETKQYFERMQLYYDSVKLMTLHRSLSSPIITEKLRIFSDPYNADLAAFARKYYIESWLEEHRDDPVAKEIFEYAENMRSNNGDGDDKEDNDSVSIIQGIISPKSEKILFAICADRFFMPEGDRYRTFQDNELADFSIEGKKALLTTTSSETITIDLNEWEDDDLKILEDTLTACKQYAKSYTEFIEKLKSCGFSSQEEFEQWLKKEQGE